jgi:protein-L-isoaspartate O-methyltransferase
MINPAARSIAPETGLSKAEIAFIQEHLQDDVSKLLLHANQFKWLDIRKIAGQIQSRQKALKKLPQWSANSRLIFPPALSVEQSSSEATARYKATLVGGDELVDITGGMGVDCYYMQPRFHIVKYFEQQPEVAEAAKYNFAQLKVSNIEVNAVNSIESLESQPLFADWIYADPARRNVNREKVVLLSDCTPDVVAHLPVLFQSAQNILLKTSPLLDIDLASRSLRNLKEVHVVGYEGECKELLFVLKKDWLPDDFAIKVRIIDGSGKIINQLDFSRETERASEARYSNPLKYLYEPHAAVLKAGAFKTICNTYLISKLAINSQLYTSDHFEANFPGRAFKIIAVCKPDAREIAKHITGDKANITVRNFPGKSEELRKKWKLKDGGKYYLFATTLLDHSKVVIVTIKPEY